MPRERVDDALALIGEGSVLGLILLDGFAQLPDVAHQHRTQGRYTLILPHNLQLHDLKHFGVWKQQTIIDRSRAH